MVIFQKMNNEMGTIEKTSKSNDSFNENVFTFIKAFFNLHYLEAKISVLM